MEWLKHQRAEPFNDRNLKMGAAARAEQREVEREIEAREGIASAPATRFGRTVLVGQPKSALIGRMLINGEPVGT